MVVLDLMVCLGLTAPTAYSTPSLQTAAEEAVARTPHVRVTVAQAAAEASYVPRPGLEPQARATMAEPASAARAEAEEEALVR